jgi:hypothetical protein
MHVVLEWAPGKQCAVLYEKIWVKISWNMTVFYNWKDKKVVLVFVAMPSLLYVHLLEHEQLVQQQKKKNYEALYKYK